MLSQLPTDAPVVVVYDITAYSFDQIFGIFARQPRSNVLMGMYNPQNQVIITGDEVIWKTNRESARSVS